MAKILVSVDDKLLARIDAAARSAGLTRSAFLSRMAERHLSERPGPGASRQAGRAVSRLQDLFSAHPGEEEATTAIRGDRDAG